MVPAVEEGASGESSPGVYDPCRGSDPGQTLGGSMENNEVLEEKDPESEDNAEDSDLEEWEASVIERAYCALFNTPRKIYKRR